jgi:large subunit ribosomal protein L5
VSATAATARLKTRYLQEIRPALMKRFGYSSVMQAPKIEKITLNMGVGDAKQDSKALKAAQDQLATIAGQQPSVRRARKSIAAFRLREGMPVGVAVTLRGERSYEFLDRLTSIAIPRIRDFRGLNPRAFDGHGNYSMGVREQIIFPEIDYDAVDQVRGLDITITTTAGTDLEAFTLLHALGMPFATDGRPKGFDEAADAAPEQSAAEEPRSADQDTADQDTADQDTADQDTADQDTADQDTADQDTADQETTD